MSSMPLNVALFIAQPAAMPCLNALLQQGRLAGVVLPPEQDRFLQQLEQGLNHQQVPCVRLSYGDEQQVVETLQAWESDLIVSFGFSGDVPVPFLEATTLGYYNLLFADPAQYRGILPLYWQIRDGAIQGQVVLQKVALQEAVATHDGANIAAFCEYDIAPLDTYKLVENKAANTAAQCVSDFVQHVVSGKVIESLPSHGEGRGCAMPDEQALTVNFTAMGARQIVDMARAGNPVFNGCVIRLGQTPLSLLQATVVNYPTYGVPPGTICHSGEPDGVIVATVDGAVRLDVIANMDGIFSAGAFAERFQISAGMAFS
ncbi:hypothetical protein VV869_23910 [Photobacterium sp. MCCC 1A19761]|uniref:hypothetical protein n=1 Tax=Photobacterium sp. MCCC 1A19761 TaxID=3115000 RepID=UPI00307E6D91